MLIYIYIYKNPIHVVPRNIYNKIYIYIILTIGSCGSIKFNIILRFAGFFFFPSLLPRLVSMYTYMYKDVFEVIINQIKTRGLNSELCPSGCYSENLYFGGKPFKMLCGKTHARRHGSPGTACTHTYLWECVRVYARGSFGLCVHIQGDDPIKTATAGPSCATPYRV